jgi:hypothetical protein
MGFVAAFVEPANPVSHMIVMIAIFVIRLNPSSPDCALQVVT